MASAATPSNPVGTSCMRCETLPWSWNYSFCIPYWYGDELTGFFTFRNCKVNRNGEVIEHVGQQFEGTLRAPCRIAHTLQNCCCSSAFLPLVYGGKPSIYSNLLAGIRNLTSHKVLCEGLCAGDSCPGVKLVDQAVAPGKS